MTKEFLNSLPERERDFYLDEYPLQNSAQLLLMKIPYGDQDHEQS